MQFKHLKKSDSELYRYIVSEIKRQNETINLIASENFVSPAILEALGSELTNKYSEGYPGKRYYPGNFYYDKIENLARERALKLFKLNPKNWEVNVQPYSGSPANMAVYFALLKPKDVILGMALANGGHLTHGHKASFSGKLYKAVQYGINPKTGIIDYKEVEKLAKKYKPKIIVSGASAYPGKIDFKKFGEIAKKVGAYHLADISHIAGLVAAELHPSPFPYADVVTMTTHKTLRGPRGAVIFARRKNFQFPRLRRGFDGQAISNFQKNKFNLAEAIDRAVFPNLQGGPHNNNIAAIAAAFKEALEPTFKNYQKQIIRNSKVLAKELKKRGFEIVAGGTDNHLMLVDLRKLGISGKEVENVLEKSGIIANRNAISGDTNYVNPGGIRIGTPSITTRGMKEKEMIKIAGFIERILIKKENPSKIKKETLSFCKKFPIYLCK